jgi:pyruvate/2-oxoglutarate/acetoin dehydrogenase E1 component
MAELYYSHALRAALEAEMARDPRMIMLGEDIAEYGGAFKVTEGFARQFGRTRVRNTPIAEGGMVGVAVGAAMTGLRPVVEIMFMDFITLALDQLINHAAKFHYQFGDQCRLPLVVRCPHGGGRGYGPTHSQSLERLLVSTPGIAVVAPATPAEAKGLMLGALRCDNPVVVLESKLLYGQRGEVPEGDEAIDLGQAQVVRAGSAVTVVAYGRMTGLARQAAAALAEHGVAAEVIDLRSLAPLDLATLTASVEKTGRLVTVEEGCLTGGIGGEIVARITEQCFDYLQAPPRRVAALDCPVPASKVLEAAVLPDARRIAEAVVAVVNY